MLDPACGSGSFLLGAYQYLLDWHLDWYTHNNPEKWARGKEPAICQSPPSPPAPLPQGEGGRRPGEGNWRLTTAEKKRILLNNIHGVDIDAQAVEVTKLSLLLKVLEGESGQLSLGFERALPDLGENIKCGNSLIGPEYYEGQQLGLGLFDEEEQYRVNAFDWKQEFGQVFVQGGFDAVIGNPPYIRIQAMKEWAPTEVEFYKKKYKAASKGNYDIYVVFVEKGLSLLNGNGALGFILPHKFFNAKYGEPVRKVISEGKHLSKVVHFGDQQVFSGATTYTCLMFLQKAGCDDFQFEKINDLEKWSQLVQQTSDVSETSEVLTAGDIKAEQVTTDEWNFIVGKSAKIFGKLASVPTRLGDIAHLFVGLQTDADDVFILEWVRDDGERTLCASKATGKEHWFEKEHLKPFLKGSLNIRRYFLANISKRLIFPYEMIKGKSELIEQKEYKKRFPLTWKYLEENRERLSSRNKGNMGKEWHEYVYKKNHTRFELPKLLVPSIATGSCFAEDLDGKYYFVGSGGGGGGGYAISLHNENLTPFYLLGLLNSSTLSFYLKSISTSFRGGYIALNCQYIEQLPIYPINFSNPTEKAQHDKMVTLVESMLELHKRLASAKTPQEKEMLSRQIELTDEAIDKLVYELYGLTEEEIRFVEGAK